jgi:hypothetical protein
MFTKEKNGPVKKLPLHHRAVLALISPHRRITVAEISKLTGFSSYRVRSTVADLVTLYHMPIGSSPRAGQSGFYIITDERDREEAVCHLESRIKHMSERVAALKKMKIQPPSEL